METVERKGALLENTKSELNNQSTGRDTECLASLFKDMPPPH